MPSPGRRREKKRVRVSRAKKKTRSNGGKSFWGDPRIRSALS